MIEFVFAGRLRYRLVALVDSGLKGSRLALFVLMSTALGGIELHEIVSAIGPVQDLLGGWSLIRRAIWRHGFYSLQIASWVGWCWSVRWA
ncbi:MAG TPA: hypothetical protein VIQ76_20830 [Propionibacteriaceae bacterium]|jgi:hypothetical protein